MHGDTITTPGFSNQVCRDAEPGNAAIRVQTLTPRERGLMDHTLTELLPEPGQCTYQKILNEVYPRLVQYIPSSVIADVTQLREIESTGYVLLRNLPLDSQLPPTPPTQPPDVLSLLPVACAALLCVARLIGEPYTYASEHDGSYITSVLPAQVDPAASTSHGAGPLPLHTETIHLLPCTPDFVALYCVRQDQGHQAPTLLADGLRVLADCSQDIIDVLREPLFWVASPKSFGRSGTAAGPMSVFAGPRDRPEIHYEALDMVPLTAEAEAALGKFRDIAATHAMEVDLQPGNLLIFDNRKILHGRGQFTPRLDGTDRWLLRALISQNLWTFRRYLSDYHTVCL